MSVTVDALHVPTMTVRIRDLATDSGRATPVVRTATVAAVCPVCGGWRGEPYDVDGVHVWDNPCGHLDSHSAVALEAVEGPWLPGSDGPAVDVGPSFCACIADELGRLLEGRSGCPVHGGTYTST